MTETITNPYVEELDPGAYIMHATVDGADVFYLKRFDENAMHGKMYSNDDYDTAEEAREAYEAGEVEWV